MNHANHSSRTHWFSGASIGHASRNQWPTRPVDVHTPAGADELHIVTDHAPVFIAQCDRHSRYRFVNRPYAERLGLAPGDLIGQRVVDTLGPDAWSVIAPHVDLVLRGVAHDFDVDVPYAVGGRKFMRCRYAPQRDAAGSVVGFVAAITDISDRKVMEDAMRASEQRLRLIVDSAVDYAIVTLDAEGIVTSWNPGAQHVTGFDANDVIGHHVRLIYTPEDRAQRQPEDEMSRALACGRADNTRWHLRKDGSRFWASGLVMPLLGDRPLPAPDASPAVDKPVDGYLLVMRDMSEKQRLDEEMERRSRALQEADRRKDEFLAIAAHELRNPLAVVLNGLRVMSRTATHDAAQREALTLMQRQGDRMMRLIDDLIGANAIARGEVPLRRQPLVLAPVLDDAIDLSRIVMASAGHRFTQHIAPGGMAIEGDSMWLTQVFTNLLTNAAKYTPRGGDIRLTAQRQGREAVVTVEDNGIGIATDLRTKVFDLYTQVQSAQVDSASGLGLGLALVKRLIERHGGSVDVSANGDGVGSCFTVRLPLLEAADVAPPASEVGAPGGAGAGRSLRILVADDSEDGARSLAMLLESFGHRVQTVADGLQAVDAVATFKPDVVLMDLEMPRLTGDEACRRIRAQTGGSDIAVVALTGSSGLDGDRRFEDSVFDEHFVKPVAVEELDAYLQRIGPC